MGIAGNRTKLAEKLKHLNPRSFVDLIADYLSRQGHTDVKVVDGPGDGSRDIHSVNPDGKRHISQCKFHKKSTKACTSAEIGETAVAMVKLNYRIGLFATNARISPQGKRELIDDFPGLSIDFLDGAALAAAVIGDTVLSAVWFRGSQIELNAVALIVPVTLRDLESDRTIPLSPPTHHFRSKHPARFNLSHLRASSHSSNGNLAFKSARIDERSLAPFRMSEVADVPADQIDLLLGDEIVVTGEIHLGDVAELCVSIGDVLAARLRAERKRGERYALRLGRPRLAPLAGESAGARLELDVFPGTLIIDANVSEESDWYLPADKSPWKAPSGFGTSASNIVRWVHDELNVGLDLTLLSTPTEDDRRSALRNQLFVRDMWSKSKFFFVPSGEKFDHQDAQVDEPPLSLPWTNGSIVGWPFVSYYSEGGFILISWPTDGPWDLYAQRKKDIANHLNAIATKMTSLGFAEVHPHVARHVAGAHGQDPFTELNVLEYRSVDLLRNFLSIPSPLRPEARRFELSAYWQLSPDSGAQIGSGDEAMCRDLRSLLGSLSSLHDIRVFVDRDPTPAGLQLAVSARILGKSVQRTDRELPRVAGIARDLIALIEPELLKHGFAPRRATRQYLQAIGNISYS